MPNKQRTDLFDLGGVFGEELKQPKVKKEKKPKISEDDKALVLKFLREGVKHRDWLLVRVTDPKGIVEALRAEGHVIKSVSLPGRKDDWVYALSEKGRLHGIAGKAGEDPDTVTQ